MTESRDPFNTAPDDGQSSPNRGQEPNVRPEPNQPAAANPSQAPLPRSERAKTAPPPVENRAPVPERTTVGSRPPKPSRPDAEPSTAEADYLVDEVQRDEDELGPLGSPSQRSSDQHQGRTVEPDVEQVGLTGLASRASRSWNQFWFGPIESSFNFSLLRTGLGITAFVWLATFIPDLTTFFGSNGLDPVPFYQTSRIGIFRWLKADIFLWIGLIVGLVASALMVWGRYVKIAGPVLAVLVASFMGENRLLWNAGDEVLRTFTLFFGFFCLLTPSYVLDTSITKASKLNVALPEGRNWLFRLIQIQMTIIYVVTFLAKIPGDMWRNGTATMTLFRLESMERFYVPDFLESNFLLGNLFTWATLLLEALLPIMLWNRRLRPFAVAAGVIFHLMIAWSISIGLFSWVMVIGYIPFLSPTFRENVNAILGRIQQMRS